MRKLVEKKVAGMIADGYTDGLEILLYPIDAKEEYSVDGYLEKVKNLRADGNTAIFIKKLSDEQLLQLFDDLLWEKYR